MRTPFLLYSTLLVLALPASAAVEMKKGPDKVRVEIGGELFTEYCFIGAPHVYFYPLIGPGGTRMTRDWPMKNTHGSVNGVDFWTEAAPGQKAKAHGRIEHAKFLEVKGGKNKGVIRDQLRWIAADGSVPVTGVQTFRVQDGAERIIDFAMTLTAGEKDVVFGDTKEGTMALRIAESMRLVGADKKPGAGKILNSAGDVDAKVWGRRAAWVDYAGLVARWWASRFSIIRRTPGTRRAGTRATTDSSRRILFANMTWTRRSPAARAISSSPPARA